MKATDLMIGDWVLAHRSVNPYADGVPHSEWNQAGQIQKIEYGYVDVKFTEYPNAPTEEERCVVEDFNQTEIELIPLTPEILEKNGFTCCNRDDDGSIQYEFGTDDLGVDVWLNTPDGICLLGAWRRWENCDEAYTMIEELPIRFIHELQHALRLCGIEKEIEL